MSKLLNITITVLDAEEYNISYVRDDDYSQRKIENTEEIKAEIKKLISFANNQKTDEEKVIEKVNEEKQKLIDIIIDKTTDKEKETLVHIFNEYEVNKDYKIDDYFKHDGFLYRVIQGHKSQINWIPGTIGTQSLYIQVGGGNEVNEFGKNLDGSERVLSVNPYKLGEQCIWQGKVYEWIDDRVGGVWSPSDYPQGWEYIREI